MPAWHFAHVDHTSHCVRRRPARMCTGYLLFVMAATTKHSLKEAARFSACIPRSFPNSAISCPVAITTWIISRNASPAVCQGAPTRHGLPPWTS